MPITPVQTSHAPAAIGPYSRAFVEVRALAKGGCVEIKCIAVRSPSI